MFAEKTKLPSEQSVAEIKKALMKFGAEGFSLGTLKTDAYIAFKYQGLAVKINFAIPSPPDESATIAQKKRYEQAVRTKWRQLLLCVKSKLECAQAGIETFEQAFMAHIESRPKSKLKNAA